MDIFAVLFYQPIYNFLILLYQILGSNLGLAIIAVAIIFRVVTIPMTMKQIKMSEDNKELQSKLKEIKELYKNNAQKIQEEQLKVQQEYLPGQIAGCLPMLVQIIMLSQIYVVLTNIFSEKGTASFNEVAYPFVEKFAENAKFNTDFLGLNIGESAGTIGYQNIGAVLPYILLALLVAVTQYLSAKILMGLRKKRGADGKEIKEEEKKPEGTPDDFGEVLQRSTQQTMMILPLMIGLFALNFPAGLALYWTVQSGFVIIQQLFIEKLRSRNESV